MWPVGAPSGAPSAARAQPPCWAANPACRLEAGATDAEVSAITGQSREMVTHYSRQVNQRKLAAAAILKWEARDDQSE